MRMRMATLGAAVIVVALASACSSIDPQTAESAFVKNAGMPISSMCDPSAPSWSCYYDGVSNGRGDLQVMLTTPGGVDGNQVAAAAGRAWFSFTHCDLPDLKTIVVTVNGVDHNVSRPAVLTNC